MQIRNLDPQPEIAKKPRKKGSTFPTRPSMKTIDLQEASLPGSPQRPQLRSKTTKPQSKKGQNNMLKLIIALTVLLFTATALAGPFIVCDPYPPEQQISGFKGILNGKPFQTPYALHSSGAAIVYDIGTLDDGPHTFKEIRAYNERDESDPVPFALPAKPQLPSHTRIAK